MGCEMKQFNKEGAMSALRIIHSKRNNKKAQFLPRRAYYCHECCAWHLTSLTANQHYRLKSRKNQDQKRNHES